MKLTKLQKHYQKFFKNTRCKFYSQKIINNHKGYKRYTKPSSVLNKLLKDNNMKLMQSYSYGNHKPQALSNPIRIEIEFNVNNIPCILSVLKIGYIAFSTHIKQINDNHFNFYPDHFGVAYTTEQNEFRMWERGTEQIKGSPKDFDKEYKNILLKELQEEDLFQYSLLYKNIHIHKILTDATKNIAGIKNFTVLQIVNELKKVIQQIQNSNMS